jgi:polygalacturonase
MIARLAAALILSLGLPLAGLSAPAGQAVFNVRDFGATGLKAGSAQAAIQKAVDACAAAGGGTVYVPPGAYSTGTIHLRSHVRFFVEAGATIYSIKDKAAFPQDPLKEALFLGEDLVNVTLEGRGTIDGQGGYDYRLKGNHEDDFIYPNQVEMEKRSLPLTRSFPKPDQFGKLVLLLRCTDVRIAGLSFLDSPSWTMHLYGCVRTVIDGLYIKSSLKDGVWADGIDPDGCRDLRISNCTISTGDDALVFYSMNWFGPALPCENITVTNCRLSSASSAIKFCDGNMNAVRNVTISNCVITESNRGLAFMNFDGGVVENVVISGLTIDCIRYDWFWWGDGEPFHFNIKQRKQIHKNWKKEDDRPAGVIRNVVLRDIVARGRGASVCLGHPDSWMDGITLDNVRLVLAHDPASPYDKAVDALTFRWVRNLRLRNVEIAWEAPFHEAWRSALRLWDVEGLEIDGLAAGRAPVAGAAAAPAIVLTDVRDAVIRDGRSRPGTETYASVEGAVSGGIIILGNDVRNAAKPFWVAPGLKPDAVRILANIEK